MKRLAGVVARVTGNSMLQRVTFTDWLDLFREIANYRPEEKKVLVIDEFPYLVKTNAAFPSILQNAWDEILKDSNVMLILCGSLISMMQKHALSHDSPLYGRRSAQIRLKPLPFTDLYAVQGQPFSQAVEQYSVTGGVPKYLEFFEPGEDLYRQIQEVVLSKNGFLYEEPNFLLKDEVQSANSYFSIIRAIADGNHKLGKIAGALGMETSSLTPYLSTLIDLDFLKKATPVTEKNPEKSRKGLYFISDNFIRFWFRYVYPYKGAGTGQSADRSGRVGEGLYSEIRCLLLRGRLQGYLCLPVPEQGGGLRALRIGYIIFDGSISLWSLVSFSPFFRLNEILNLLPLSNIAHIKNNYRIFVFICFIDSQAVVREGFFFPL